MSTYRMDDGTVVDTDKASAQWDEAANWNGNNWISVNTGSQWSHECLYRSRKGRYYIKYQSAWQGSTPHAEWVTDVEAARWLLLNEKELPQDLAAHADAVTE